MELNEAVASVAKELRVSSKKVSSAISQYIESLKKRRDPGMRARGHIKLDPSRNVKLSEETWGLEKIPVITLTSNVRLGIYIKPGTESENKKIAVHMMRWNEDTSGLYNSSALTSGEINVLNRNGWKNTPIRSPGMVRLAQR